LSGSNPAKPEGPFLSDLALTCTFQTSYLKSHSGPDERKEKRKGKEKRKKKGVTV
jgi:hypothetical protein